MHRVFSAFVDAISDGVDQVSLHAALSDVAEAFGIPHFAYYWPNRSGSEPQVISNYPADWLREYFLRAHQRIDPVIRRAGGQAEPFLWNASSRKLYDEEAEFMAAAAGFGIGQGITLPIHGHSAGMAALTFAADAGNSSFRDRVQLHGATLHLLAIYFHRHASRILSDDRMIDGVRLTGREMDCLQWAARGKSAWEIGRILRISRKTASFHLDNVREKLLVRTISQAVARLAASKKLP